METKIERFFEFCKKQKEFRRIILVMFFNDQYLQVMVPRSNKGSIVCSFGENKNLALLLVEDSHDNLINGESLQVPTDREFTNLAKRILDLTKLHIS